MVVGSPRTLSSEPVWRKWLDWVRDHGAFLTPNALPPAPWEADEAAAAEAEMQRLWSPPSASFDDESDDESVYATNADAADRGPQGGSGMGPQGGRALGQLGVALGDWAEGRGPAGSDRNPNPSTGSAARDPDYNPNAGPPDAGGSGAAQRDDWAVGGWELDAPSAGSLGAGTQDAGAALQGSAGGGGAVGWSSEANPCADPAGEPGAAPQDDWAVGGWGLDAPSASPLGAGTQEAGAALQDDGAERDGVGPWDPKLKATSGARGAAAQESGVAVQTREELGNPDPSSPHSAGAQEAGEAPLEGARKLEPHQLGQPGRRVGSEVPPEAGGFSGSDLGGWLDGAE